VFVSDLAAIVISAGDLHFVIVVMIGVVVRRAFLRGGSD
jgi:hypothetical protein